MYEAASTLLRHADTVLMVAAVFDLVVWGTVAAVLLWRRSADKSGS